MPAEGPKFSIISMQVMQAQEPLTDKLLQLNTSLLANDWYLNGGK